MPRLITLLTDFGTADGYVGEMKGVLASLAPGATVIDVAHDVAPHDVEGARLALARYWRRFPEGTVHLVVVDPGVGSTRGALATLSEGRFLVGPNNGVLSPALLHAGARCVSLGVPGGAAPTFHGRDVFAPAAARLALGEALETLGADESEPIIRRTPEATRRDDGGVQGEVITVDRFGNAVTNLLAMRGGQVQVGGLSLALRRTYADVTSGDPMALVGSSGLVEIAVRDGSAAQRLGLKRGSSVVLLPRP
ncbi:MAG TPA: SAM-dependent chlorinase/fluorinase [Gemmatimonadaceae bacterium]|nr:SAM-dependent chlorinase/fluorinase [Gemmatimonadaceae bacterium]